MIKRSRRLVFFSLLLTWPKWHTRPTLPSSVFDSYSNCKPSVQSTMRLEPTQRDAISWLGQVNWYLIDLTKLTSFTWTTMLPARRPSLGAKTLKRFCVPASRTPRGIPGCINTRPARKVAPHAVASFLRLPSSSPIRIYVSCLVNFYYAQKTKEVFAMCARSGLEA